MMLGWTERQNEPLATIEFLELSWFDIHGIVEDFWSTMLPLLLLKGKRIEAATTIERALNFSGVGEVVEVITMTKEFE